MFCKYLSSPDNLPESFQIYNLKMWGKGGLPQLFRYHFLINITKYIVDIVCWYRLHSNPSEFKFPFFKPCFLGDEGRLGDIQRR